MSDEERTNSEQASYCPNFEGDYYRYEIWGFGHRSVVPATAFTLKATELKNADGVNAVDTDRLLSDWAYTYSGGVPEYHIRPKMIGTMPSRSTQGAKRLVMMAELEDPVQFTHFKNNRDQYFKKENTQVRKLNTTDIESLIADNRATIFIDPDGENVNVYGFGKAGQMTFEVLFEQMQPWIDDVSTTNEQKIEQYRALCLAAAATNPPAIITVEDWPTTPEVDSQNDERQRMMEMMQMMMGGARQGGNDEYPACRGCGKHHAPGQ